MYIYHIQENSEWIKALNVTPEAIILVEETGRRLCRKLWQ